MGAGSLVGEMDLTSDGGFVLGLLFLLSLTGFIGLCCKKKKREVERKFEFVESTPSDTRTPRSSTVSGAVNSPSSRRDEDESVKSEKKPKKKEKTKSPKKKLPPLPDGIEFRAPKDPAYRTLAGVKSDNIYGPSDEDLEEQKKLDLERPTIETLTYVFLSFLIARI